VRLQTVLNARVIHSDSRPSDIIKKQNKPIKTFSALQKFKTPGMQDAHAAERKRLRDPCKIWFLEEHSPPLTVLRKHLKIHAAKLKLKN